MVDQFRIKDEDETGITNIQEVKTVFEWINNDAKEGAF